MIKRGEVKSCDIVSVSIKLVDGQVAYYSNFDLDLYAIDSYEFEYMVELWLDKQKFILEGGV